MWQPKQSYKVKKKREKKATKLRQVNNIWLSFMRMKKKANSIVADEIIMRYYL